MKNRMLIALALLSLVSSAVASDPVVWTADVLSANAGGSEAMAIDSEGNIYLAGTTKRPLSGTGPSGYNSVLIKFDADGNELWTQVTGTTEDDRCHALAVDSKGNAYIAGSTEGDLDGDNAGQRDVFLTKFDPDGNEQWTLQMGTEKEDYANSLLIDADDNLYLGGTTRGDLCELSQGDYDAFLIKLDPYGNEVWARQIGSEKPDYTYAAAVDAEGNVLITGWTQGDLGGANAGGWDGFIAKFNSAGLTRWVSHIGTSGSDQPSAIVVDDEGDAYISGTTRGDFSDEGQGNRADAFVIRFDASGGEVWTREVGTSADDECLAVAIGPEGNLYLAGATMGDFEQDETYSTADSFVIQLDTSGQVLWNHRIETPKRSRATAVAVDADGQVFLSGSTSRPDVSYGITNAYLTKLTIPETEDTPNETP